MRSFYLVLGLMTALGAGACNYKTQKQDSPQIPQIDQSAASAIPDFAAVQTQILEVHCTGCHGSMGGVDLTNYENVVTKLDRIRVRIQQVDDPMPPSGIMPPEELSVLLAWIDAGAPEFVSPE